MSARRFERLALLPYRRPRAVAGYREALRGWRSLGLAFGEAMAAPDLAVVLAPTEREMPEAASVIEESRETLTRLGARPLLTRLKRCRAVTTEQAPPASAVT